MNAPNEYCRVGKHYAPIMMEVVNRKANVVSLRLPALDVWLKECKMSADFNRLLFTAKSSAFISNKPGEFEFLVPDNAADNNPKVYIRSVQTKKFVRVTDVWSLEGSGFLMATETFSNAANIFIIEPW